MPIAIVNQSPVKLADGGGATKTVTIPSTTAGNTLVLLCSNTTHNNYLQSVSCNSVGFTNIFQVTNASLAANTSEMWALPNVAGGRTSITVTLPANYDGVCEVTCVEVSGMPTTLTQNPVGGATNTGRSVSASASCPNAAGTNSIFFAIASSNGAVTNSPSGGFTALTLAAGTSGVVGWGYLIQPSSTTPQAPAFTVAHGYDFWTAGTSGLDGGGGGGGNVKRLGWDGGFDVRQAGGFIG